MPENSEKNTGRMAIADLPRIRSEQFVSAYVNHTEASLGFYELNLVFSRIGKARDGNLTIYEEVGVALSWEHAIRVRDLLVRMVDAYEEKQGKIRLMHEDEEPELAQPAPVDSIEGSGT